MVTHANTHTTEKGTVLPVMDLKGKAYLQVQYRIVWFREVHPLGRIDTEVVRLDEKHAVVSATISVPSGNGYIKLADAMKCEYRTGFEDYTEKAQTGAIGRALALCGFGTQFCADELDEEERLADSPGKRPKASPRPAAKPAQVPGLTPPGVEPTAAQPRPTYILSLIDAAKAAGLRRADLEGLISLRYPAAASVDVLTQAETKTLLEDIKKLPPGSIPATTRAPNSSVTPGGPTPVPSGR